MKDEHLGTGEYDPQKYWEARAKASGENIYKAVCVFSYSDEENQAAEKIQKSTLRWILRGIDLKNRRVMELGCGAARWAPFFLKRGALYTGVDISDTMLELARSRMTDCQFYKIDSNRLPFEDDKFDLVFSITVLHHNSYEQQRELIIEMIRITKPGRFILLMEDIAARRARSFFNMFPRPIEDWVAEVEHDGRARLVRVKLSHCWLLRDITLKLMRSLGISSANRENMKALNMFLVRSGRYIDPCLMWLLPRRFATNAAMLFIKAKKRK